jgi:hypothetical protein
MYAGLLAMHERVYVRCGKGTHNAILYHRVHDYLLHLIYGILLM